MYLKLFVLTEAEHTLYLFQETKSFITSDVKFRTWRLLKTFGRNLILGFIN